MLLGGYFGLLAGLLAYNGFLALRLRDPAYGYCIAFGIGLGVFQLSSTGFGPSFLWSRHARMGVLPPLMAAITLDLQQPLYALSLATESLARQNTQPMPSQALTQMRSALFSADELMASLAMNVRLDRENLLPEFEVFSVQSMLERIDALFATRAQQAGLRWRVPPSWRRPCIEQAFRRCRFSAARRRAPPSSPAGAGPARARRASRGTSGP
ncbi:7TM-DISM domain-containing protein [Hydrogenophaga borbori]|uniref:7TM-DISM domain-containing protein n=1 Tax=Hydrogenophaga borbori TaxID=2294117 RepID=UPI001FEA1025|nr:7TM-DISM domain-containing protein [Hydrogenophaga borbori]